jgi:regulator of protease activity HflC (stomatin/prohibitin superfamily)
MVDEPHKTQHAAPPGGLNDEDVQGLDAASQSLTKALKLSFRILSVAMVFLLIIFLAQGIYTVKPGEKALILRFGKAASSRVYAPGPHFKWPRPIHEKIIISTSVREVDVNTFWPRVTDEQKKESMEKATSLTEKMIRGARGGHLITGDFSILEARWNVQYRVSTDADKVIQYYQYFGADPMRKNEKALVTALVENAVIRTIAKMDAFDAVVHKKTALAKAVNTLVGEALEDQDCGLELTTSINLVAIQPPEGEAKEAFNALRSAESRKKQLITEAEKFAKALMIKTAGAHRFPDKERYSAKLQRAIGVWWQLKSAAFTIEFASEGIQRIVVVELAADALKQAKASKNTSAIAVAEKRLVDAKNARLITSYTKADFESERLAAARIIAPKLAAFPAVDASNFGELLHKAEIGENLGVGNDLGKLVATAHVKLGESQEHIQALMLNKQKRGGIIRNILVSAESDSASNKLKAKQDAENYKWLTEDDAPIAIFLEDRRVEVMAALLERCAEGYIFSRDGGTAEKELHVEIPSPPAINKKRKKVKVHR